MMRKPRPVIARPRLTPADDSLADALSEYLLLHGADLGDESAVAAALLQIPNEDLPRGVAGRLFDEALERARAKRQARASLTELTGAA